MLDQLRRDIERRLDDVLDEADALRRALVALGSHEPATAPAARDGSSPTWSRRATPSGRRTPGATTSAVLAALGSGTAMTAGEVARATGIGRASVSTTLSKLSKSGEVTKAARGYRVATDHSREKQAA